MILILWQLLLVLAIRGIVGLIVLICLMWDDILVITFVFIGDLFCWSAIRYPHSALGLTDWFPETPVFWWECETLPLDQRLEEHLPLYREKSPADIVHMTHTADTTDIVDIVDPSPQPSTHRSSKQLPSTQLQSPTLAITTLSCVAYNLTIYNFSNLRPERMIVNSDYSMIIFVGCLWALALIEGRVVFVLLREMLRGLRGLRRLLNRLRGKSSANSVTEELKETEING